MQGSYDYRKRKRIKYCIIAGAAFAGALSAGGFAGNVSPYDYTSNGINLKGNRGVTMTLGDAGDVQTEESTEVSACTTNEAASAQGEKEAKIVQANESEDSSDNVAADEIAGDTETVEEDEITGTIQETSDETDSAELSSAADITDESSGAVSDPYTYEEMSQTLYAAQDVYVRSGPNMDFEAVGVLSGGEQVSVTGRCNETGWYRISYNGTDAYVSYKYVGDSNTASVVKGYTIVDMDTTLVATQDVNVRSGPKMDYDIVEWLLAGDTAHVTGQCTETGWYRVECHGVTGYVSYKYTTIN